VGLTPFTLDNPSQKMTLIHVDLEIPQNSQSDHHSIQYLSDRAALLYISLQSDGNIHLTGAMGANTVCRIKSN
jgi:hypothetical protein